MDIQKLLDVSLWRDYLKNLCTKLMQFNLGIDNGMLLIIHTTLSIASQPYSCQKGVIMYKFKDQYSIIIVQFGLN